MNNNHPKSVGMSRVVGSPLNCTVNKQRRKRRIPNKKNQTKTHTHRHCILDTLSIPKCLNGPQESAFESKISAVACNLENGEETAKKRRRNGEETAKLFTKKDEKERKKVSKKKKMRERERKWKKGKK